MLQKALLALEPPAEETFPEWCERRVIMPGVSARGGAWDNDYARFQVGIMEAFADPRYPEVVVMKPTQAGISTIASLHSAWRMDTDPGPAILGEPTEDDLKDFFSQKYFPLIDASPDLARKVIRPRRGQAGGSTVTQVRYPGGWLQGASANSPGSFQMRSARDLYGDELDEWPNNLGSGGDSLSQAIMRTRTFGSRRKILMFGKPKERSTSRLWRLYQESDRRQYHVPCPACGKAGTLKWAQVRWPEDRPEEARIHCIHCDHAMDDRERLRACSRGEWIATNPGHWRAGFQFPSWITPWVQKLGDLAKAFLEAKRGGPETLQVFVNSEMGEAWEDSGEVLDPTSLEARAEDYELEPMPNGVLVLVAGVDCQVDRLEMELLGVGLDSESWSLDYYRIPGDPSNPADICWRDLEQILLRRYRHRSGSTLPISAACIDSGDGNSTDAVYAFCTPRGSRRVYAIKGRSGPEPIWKRLDSHRRIRERGASKPVHIVGVDSAKDRLHSQLQVASPGPGYCHMPDRHPPEWFEMLTAEERVIQWSKGRAHKVWKRKAGRPNEALDCRIYAMAALESLLAGGLDIARLAAVRDSGAITQEPRAYVPRKRMITKGLAGLTGAAARGGR